MNALPPKIPFVQISGSPEDLGFQHGRLLKDRVKANFEFYTEALFDNQNNTFDFKGHGLAFLDIIADRFPQYALEIEGIAKGADMQPWQIATLNARTEIFLKANDEKINECTAVVFPEHRLMGQNWDWMAACEDLAVMMELTREDGHQILMMAEPGIIGKIGINSRGLGLMLNLLIGRKPYMETPIHVLLRAVLDQDDVAGARDMLLKQKPGSYSHLFLLDDTGATASLEFAGDHILEVDYLGMTPIHTNHYLSEPSLNDAHNEHIVDSQVRMRRARQLTRDLEEHSLEEIQKILHDDQDPHYPICKRWRPLWDDLKHGTVCSLLFDVVRRELRVTRGNPFDHPYQTYRLSS